MLKVGRRVTDILCLFGYSGFALLSLYTCPKLFRLTNSNWCTCLSELESRKNDPELQSLRLSCYHTDWKLIFEKLDPIV